MKLRDFYNKVFVPYSESTYSETTLIRIRGRFLRAFVYKFAALALSELRPDAINAFLLDYQQLHKLTSNSMSANKFAIRAVLLRAEALEYIPSPITPKLFMFAAKNKQAYSAFTKEELKLLLTSLKEKHSDWYYIFAVAALTGMRYGELLELKWDAVKQEDRVIRVIRSRSTKAKSVNITKTGAPRIVPINDALYDILVELGFRNEEYVLPRLPMFVRGQASMELSKITQKLKLPRVRFHDFRAFFATELLAVGAPSYVIMKMGGWSSPTTLARYARMANINIKGMTECLKIE